MFIQHLSSTSILNLSAYPEPRDSNKLLKSSIAGFVVTHCVFSQREIKLYFHVAPLRMKLKIYFKGLHGRFWNISTSVFKTIGKKVIYFIKRDKFSENDDL